MEIVIGIVVVIVIILFLGGLDNDRPVKSWSDDKLQRMHGKLLIAANAALKAGNFEKSCEHSQKAKEVEQEIETRKQQRLKDLGKNQFNLDNTKDFVDLAQLMAEKSMQLLHKTMQENSCTEDQAKDIVSVKIENLTKEFKAQGFNEEDANEKALQQLLGISN